MIHKVPFGHKLHMDYEGIKQGRLVLEVPRRRRERGAKRVRKCVRFLGVFIHFQKE
jgi:hypothetical protein